MKINNTTGYTRDLDENCDDYSCSPTRAVLLKSRVLDIEQRIEYLETNHSEEAEKMDIVNRMRYLLKYLNCQLSFELDTRKEKAQSRLSSELC